MKLSQTEIEDLRFAVREQLVAAKTVALTAEMVLRRVERARVLNFAIDLAQVDDAIAVIVALEHAKRTYAPLGGTPYYQATAAGILAHERGQ